MAHLESEKNAKQLVEINKLKKVLPYLEKHRNKNIIELGSAIKTNDANYYISISLGKIRIENEYYFAMSAVTPLGKLLIGKTTGDSIRFNGKSINIIEVF